MSSLIALFSIVIVGLIIIILKKIDDDINNRQNFN
jgi:hypothetical protein